MSLDVYLKVMKPTEVYSGNITHNLGKMADAAGIYMCLWRPEEFGIKTAGELINPLTTGLKLLRKNRTHYEQLNPENGWGNYDNLVSFVEKYLNACKENPEATVEAIR